MNNGCLDQPHRWGHPIDAEPPHRWRVTVTLPNCLPDESVLTPASDIAETYLLAPRICILVCPSRSFSESTGWRAVPAMVLLSPGKSG